MKRNRRMLPIKQSQTDMTMAMRIQGIIRPQARRGTFLASLVTLSLIAFGVINVFTTREANKNPALVIRGAIIEQPQQFEEEARGSTQEEEEKEQSLPLQSIELPSYLQNHLSNIKDPRSPEETPLFWHIAKAGGTSVKNMYSECYGLVQASESGITEGHGDETELQVVTLESTWKYVNVDTSLEPGIDRAASMGLIPSQRAQLVVSPLLHTATAKLFTNKHRARAMVLFRHPLDRVVSLFYYLKKATWEPTYNPELLNMTLGEYVNSTLLETNFMVRSLINKMEAPLTDQDFIIAKELLRTKFLVGLLEDLEESLRRFDWYFEFTGNAECRNKYIHHGANRQTQPHQLPPVESFAFKELSRKNFMDLWLYDFVKELYAEQAALIS